MAESEEEVSHRAAFANAAERLEHSPLYHLLCRRVAEDRLYEEGTFAYFVREGAPLETWKDARKVLTATHSLLRERGGKDYLAEYFPVLGGHRPPDERAYQLFREFLRDRRSTIALRLGRPAVLNDPAGGTRVYALLTDYLRHAYADPVPVDLLCVGAAAGLELVADRLDPAEGLLRGHEVVRRLGVDLAPVDVARQDQLDWLLSFRLPEDVAGQVRTMRATQLLVDEGVVVDQRDAFRAAAAPVTAPAVPVVFGVSFLCSVEQPGRVHEVLRQREGDVIWISDEAAGVLTHLGLADDLEGVDPSSRVTRLMHYREGEIVGSHRQIT
ncbi:DUF2332 family protein [Leekyejoonella antrihumi]|uniref:DUF2332 family protein n=1 Tax=Leekyejoonella antrihumi TaxID=1660198 RepID=A0A563DUL2_9MICO|nr:DUF2332 family protein [Leekyejoonella antrihumi]TWP33950.1 DUF2332 family protein [Leekyejoonella antrihumi]